MGRSLHRAIVAAAAIWLVVPGSVSAHLSVFTMNGCLAGKLRTLGKGTKAYVACHAKDAAHPDAPKLAACLGKASIKITGGFARLDAKHPGACTAPNGDGPGRDGAAASYAAALAADVGSATGKCDAAKQRCVGSYAAALLGCYARAANKSGTVDNAPGGCTAKAEHTLVDAVKGCLVKAAAAGDCTNAGTQGAALESGADAYDDGQACQLDPSASGCASVPSATPTPTPPTTPTPTATFVLGSCPSSIVFAPDGTAANDFDYGWRGFGHNQPFASGGALTVAGTGPSGGDCGFAGPIPNAGANAGTIDNQRCTGDTATHCTNAPGGTGGPCTGLGTCEFYWGPPMPLSIGGLGICIVDRIAGAVTGTVNTTSGALARALPITRTLYGFSVTDAPCPRCVGDPTPNDGAPAGTCNGGARGGLACDANGTIPAWPDNGAVSLDCPPSTQILTATKVLHGTTGTTDLTIAATSPRCTGNTALKCACDTCNSLGSEGCASNADCPVSDGHFGICGGRRCIGGDDNGLPCHVCFGGSNDAAGCSAASGCPGGTCVRLTCAAGGVCGRRGEPTEPNYCVDNTTTPADETLCQPVGGHEGRCPDAPVIGRCSVASGHRQRYCNQDSDCCDDAGFCTADPVSVGDCELEFVPCFLDNGILGGSIVGEGAADPPVGGVASPTLAHVFCEEATSTAWVNNGAGVPGPARLELTETMTLIP